MDNLINLLLKAFGNNFTYYLKTHNYHWIVLGRDFPQYHKVLEKIYSDAQENIDNYAEQLRRLGVFPQGNYLDIISETELKDTQENPVDPVLIWTSILADLKLIVNTLQDTYDEANKFREYGLQNFLAERIDTHRKTQWMLSAILGDQNLNTLPEILLRAYPDGEAIPDTLPEKYQLATNPEVPPGQNCGNCQYNQDGYCELFNAQIREIYWCARWQAASQIETAAEEIQ
jgi:starvation-inducible DNA-binding protein